MHTDHIATLLRRSDAVASSGILAAGVVHTSLTPVFKPQGGEEALWFAGSGLALCMVGALNLLRRAPDASAQTRWACRSANVATTAYLLLVARALRAPHVYLVLALVSLATVHSFRAATTAAAWAERHYMIDNGTC